MGSLSCKGRGTAWEPRVQLTAFPRQRDAHRRADGGEDSRCTHLLREGDAIPLVSGALASCYARPYSTVAPGSSAKIATNHQPSAVGHQPSRGRVRTCSSSYPEMGGYCAGAVWRTHTIRCHDGKRLCLWGEWGNNRTASMPLLHTAASVYSKTSSQDAWHS